MSPSTWVVGFSDNVVRDTDSKDYMCAISANSTELIDKMKDNCCKGEVHEDDTGCFHWCHPEADSLVEWASCIADYVYPNTEFGQQCNKPGDLAVEYAEQQGEEPPGGTSGAVARASVGWKLGFFLGVGLLAQAMC